MTAQIIPLCRPENGETPAPLSSSLRPSFHASAGGAARRWWHRARMTIEVFGWIMVVASVIAFFR